MPDWVLAVSLLDLMRIKVLVLAIGLAALPLWAADPPAGAGPRWTRVGSRGVSVGLAGVVGGPVSDVAFSLDGRVLYVRTGSGRVWASSDLGETWERFQLAPGETSPFSGSRVITSDARAPSDDPGALVVVHPFDWPYLFALGRDLHRSIDGGETWINLTQDGLGSIIGPWQVSIAFSPLDRDTIAVSNSVGVWKSADKGLTWVSLNENLPNFPGGRFLAPAADGGVRLIAASFGEIATSPGAGMAWQPVSQAARGAWLDSFRTLPAEDQLRHSDSPLLLPSGVLASFRIWMNGDTVSGDLTVCGIEECQNPGAHFISAFAQAGDEGGFYYVGTSDGLIWISEDQGETWRPAFEGLPRGDAAVSAIFGNPREPHAAIAVLDAGSGGRVLRTTNGGVFWDDLTADLPPGALYAVAADPSTGALYVAGEAGVFYTVTDLRAPSPPTPWRSVAGNLPRAAVRDLALDTVTGQLYASVDAYGIYRARAPAVTDALRVLNAADLSLRAAAPGGLLTVLGGGLRAATVRGSSAPILLSDAYQAQIQVPFDAAGDRLSLSLQTPTGTTRIGYPLADVSPAVFVDRGSPLVLDAGTGVLLGARHPAIAGSHILILATGLGKVKPDWPTGVPAPLEDPPATVQPVKAYLNGAPLRVISSTLAGGYIGTYMIEVELPSVLNAGTAELVLEVGGRTSNTVRIYTEP